jgi:CDP-diacylglycerol--glycerol-3-phosphate 3-phosphatidyltransferase
MSSPAVTWGPLVALTSLFFGALGVFSVRVALVGLPSSERAQKVGGSVVLSRFFLEYGLWLFRPAVNVLVKLRVHPDTLSWSSLILHFFAGLALALGGFAFGGWMLVIGVVCDSLDGSVARARNLSSDAGEVLDAVIDRWAEMAVFFGLAWYYRNDLLGFLCALGACAGAIMVSYTRAKGETLGIDAKQGLMQRHERAAYLTTAICFSAFIESVRPSTGQPRYMLTIVVLAFMAVLGNVTGVIRTTYIRSELRRR